MCACKMKTYFILSLLFLNILMPCLLARAATTEVAHQQLLPDTISNSTLLEIAFSPAWLRLLHYLPNGHGWQSELRASGFFFAKDGRDNPQSELSASIYAMTKNIELGNLKLHPQCAFPDRYNFLKKTFNLQIRDVPCPKFQEFLSRFHEPESVSVVFSGAYPNNPSAMFGHTFLKFNSSRKSELLNYGINYAAAVPQGENPFAFMYFGVTGGYRGQWSAEPYFTKVNTYINSESRDLWEHHLTLTKAETHRLLAHIWELEVNSIFNYYFFDKNCSYEILRAIEAIRPDWTFSQHRIYVMPGETIKRLYDVPNVISKVSYRPSLYHQLKATYTQLDPKEQEHFLHLLHKPTNGLEDLSQFSTRELDTTLLALKYFKMKSKNKFSSDNQTKENLLLNERSHRPEKPEEIIIPSTYKLTRPELSHDPYSLTLTTGSDAKPNQADRGFLGLRFKTAYHDLMAKDDGLTPFSEIDFPWFELRYKNDKLKLYQLGLVDITSLFINTAIEKQVSWRMRLSLDTDETSACANCSILRGEGGGGYASGNIENRFYVLAILRQEFHRRLYHGYRTRPGLEASWVYNPSFHTHHNYKMRLTAIALADVNPQPDRNYFYEFEWGHAYSIKRNQEVRLASTFNYIETLSKPDLTQVKIEWMHYFR